jgi:hypothetical protein
MERNCRHDSAGMSGIRRLSRRIAGVVVASSGVSLFPAINNFSTKLANCRSSIMDETYLVFRTVKRC